MKNNPKTKYILIGLVVLIWGLIIYKIVSGFSDVDTVVVQAYVKSIERPDIDTAYQLLNQDYSDPFFNENVYEEIEVDTFQITSNEAKPPLPKAIQSYPTLPSPPPSVKYNGYIYNPETKIKTALITYNGRSMVVNVADKLDDNTKITKIDSRELVVLFEGQYFVYKISS